MTNPIPPYGPGGYSPTGTEQPGTAQPRMVPVERPVTKPTVTYTILAITVFVYLLQELTRMGIAREPFLALSQMIFGPEVLQALLQNGWGDSLLTLLGGKINELIIAGQYWRLLTPALLHASLTHIGFNMYALYAIGSTLESFYGHQRFLMLYIVGALGGNVLSFLMTRGLSVGASTAIFALVAAEGVFIYQNRAIFGSQARAMLSNVVFIVIINLGLGFLPGIDNFGHLGGLIAGLAFGWFAGPRFEVEPDFTGRYKLVDKSNPSTAWLVAIVMVILILGVAFLRIRQG
ncbi:MAG: rhomboid family intramembrane serine protease [Chloroflexi bacterium]|nr:MAG: rhomboid family intramembrane serine protease [Chloroflexota bacterium]